MKQKLLPLLFLLGCSKPPTFESDPWKFAQQNPKVVSHGIIFPEPPCGTHNGVVINCAPRFDGTKYDFEHPDYDLTRYEIMEQCIQYINKSKVTCGVCHQMDGGPLVIESFGGCS